LLIAVKVIGDTKVAASTTVDVQDDVQDDSNPVVHDDDSEDESGDEDDKLVEEFSAREASTYPSRPTGGSEDQHQIEWNYVGRNRENASVRIQFQTHHLVVGR
jgi:hypothetical protein